MQTNKKQSPKITALHLKRTWCAGRHGADLLIYWAHGSTGPRLPVTWSAVRHSISQKVPGLQTPTSSFQIPISDFEAQISSFQAPASRPQTPISRILSHLDGWILPTPWLETHFWSPWPQKSSFQHEIFSCFEVDVLSICKCPF